MQSFNDLPGLTLSPTQLDALRDDSISVPTAIQAQGVGPILEGRSVVLHSGTGSGKTLAYLLPILQRLSAGAATRAVVLAPSAELAMQTLRVAERYREEQIATGALVATGSHKQQKARVNKSTRFIVGTPGRVLEMYRARKLKNVNVLVLDEPDPILTSKEADYLREVVSRPDPRLQVVVVGATVGPAAQRFVEDSLESPVWVRAEDDVLHARIRHLIVGVRDDDAKDVRVARFIDKHRCKRVILFVTDDRLIGHLYRYLGEHGHNPVSLSHERPKHEHSRAIAQFGAGEAKVLITSDRAARGLDVADVPWVFHYDVPRSAPVYLHRAGRTARAGKHGTSVSFCLPTERARLKAFARELDLQFETA